VADAFGIDQKRRMTDGGLRPAEKRKWVPGRIALHVRQNFHLIDFSQVNNNLTRKLRLIYFIGDGMGQKGSGYITSDNGGDDEYYFSS